MEKISEKEFRKIWSDYSWRLFINLGEKHEVDLFVDDKHIKASTKAIVKTERRWLINSCKLYKKNETIVVKINEMTWLEGDKKSDDSRETT